MMYILYNSDGSIKQTKFTEFIQQGNNNVNKVFVEYEDDTDITASAFFTLPDGSTTVVAGEFHEDYEYETDKTANGFLFKLTSNETKYPGIVFMTLQLQNSLTNEILRTYQVNLTINKTNYQVDETNMNLAQYTNLVNYVNTTLANYYYTITEVDTLFTSYYTKTQVDTLLEDYVKINSYQTTDTLNVLTATPQVINVGGVSYLGRATYDGSSYQVELEDLCSPTRYYFATYSLSSQTLGEALANDDNRADYLTTKSLPTYFVGESLGTSVESGDTISNETDQNAISNHLPIRINARVYYYSTTTNTTNYTYANIDYENGDVIIHIAIINISTWEITLVDKTLS